MAGRKLSYSIFLFCVVNGAFGGIPALLWNSKADFEYPVSLAGHTLDSDSFYKGFLQQLIENKQNNIVIFVQDQLSIDDITRYADVFNDGSQGAVYTSVREIMENYASTYVPSIKNPTAAVDQLETIFEGNVVFKVGDVDMEDLTLEKDRQNLIIIDLPATSSGGKLEALVKSDQIMGRVTAQLAVTGKPFSAVYTGKEQSTTAERMPHKGRQILQADDEAEVASYSFFNLTDADNKPCFFMYFTQITLNILRSDSGEVSPDDLEKNRFNMTNVGTQVPGGAVIQADSSCNNSKNAYLHAVFTGLPDGVTKFEMKMTLKSYMRYWQIDNLSLNFAGTTKDSGEAFTGNETMENNNKTIFGALGYSSSSYHCNQPKDIKQFDRGEEKKPLVSLGFTDLQLQLGVTDDSFSRADDCVGFFSEAIWMGLVASLVLILILTFGISMLASINTMDRFDDPKGKTIQVNTSE